MVENVDNGHEEEPRRELGSCFSCRRRLGSSVTAIFPRLRAPRRGGVGAQAGLLLLPRAGPQAMDSNHKKGDFALMHGRNFSFRKVCTFFNWRF